MDRPILFSSPMVRALLAGTKSQTRRVFKLPTKGIYERKDMGSWAPTTNGGGGSFTIGRDGTRTPAPETVGIWHRTTGRCLNAPYQVRDRLYVREAWRAGMARDRITPRDLQPGSFVAYEADGPHDCEAVHGRFRQGMHMPRWASRLTLIVSEVRVQRLQDIDEADARAEGITSDQHDDGRSIFPVPGHDDYASTAKGAYRKLWNGLNESRGFGWETNPWCIAVSFSVIKQNIDQVKP